MSTGFTTVSSARSVLQSNVGPAEKPTSQHHNRLQQSRYTYYDDLGCIDSCEQEFVPRRTQLDRYDSGAIQDHRLIAVPAP
jgi:hypothetical protein